MVLTFISSSRLGGTICAERTAIVKAVVQNTHVFEADGQTEGHTKFIAIGVATYNSCARTG